MPEWTARDKSVLGNNLKPLIHMRRQFKAKRFGLVFGTGLTQPLGIPGWGDLNKKIAEDANVNAPDLLGRPSEETVKEFLEKESFDALCGLLGAGPEETIVTQRLFEHYRALRRDKVTSSKHYTVQFNSDVQRDWRSIIRGKLYQDSHDNDDIGKLARIILDKHPYLQALLPIIGYSPLTVTYNFDDVLEVVLNGSRSDEQREKSRGYETTIDIRIPPRQTTAVVYHPNGYIPRNTMEGGYEGIVLSEDEFADRMIETMTGQYASLLHHYSKNTCLFIGLSLKDSILKNLLRQCATVTPGHYHYYVHWYDEKQPVPKDEREAIRKSNFTTYNLITLFLCSDDIASVGKLLTSGLGESGELSDDSIFANLAEDLSLSPVRHFYVVGAVGAGKSTVVSHLRDLVTHDEWVEDRLPELAEVWHDLDDDERQNVKKQKIDEWIAQQFHEKNHRLAGEDVGLVVSDRCPLDPMVFTAAEDWRTKAQYLLERVCPGADTKIVPGHVIFLKNDPQALDLRVRRTNKKYRRRALDEMQKALAKVYAIDGVSVIDARFRHLQDIMQEVARIIHMEDLPAAQIHERLVDIKEGRHESAS